MSTYADCQTAPSPDNLWMVPQEYDLSLAPRGLSYVESDASDAFTVVGIPATVRPDRVARHMRMIAIYPHPDELMWSAVADLPPGSFIRGRRDGYAAKVTDSAHWSGSICIGWMRP